MHDRTGLTGLQRAAIIVGAIAVLVVAYLVIQSGGDDSGKKTSSTATPPAVATTPQGSTSTATTPPAPTVPTVRVVNAKPDGGVKKLEFNKGDQVRFRIVSDTADEIHVHGYDLKKDVPKGGSVTFAFKGSIDGRFVVELEGHGEQIAELDVAP